MSRHTIINDTRRATYGFDRPLSEYFLQIWKDDEFIESETGSAGAIMEFAQQWGVTLPDLHLEKLALDLPIDDNPAPGGEINAETFDDHLAVIGGLDDEEGE